MFDFLKYYFSKSCSISSREHDMPQTQREAVRDPKYASRPSGEANISNRFSLEVAAHYSTKQKDVERETK